MPAFESDFIDFLQRAKRCTYAAGDPSGATRRACIGGW